MALPLHHNLCTLVQNADLGHIPYPRELVGGHHRRQSSHPDVGEGKESAHREVWVGMVDCSRHRGLDLRHTQSRSVRCDRTNYLCLLRSTVAVSKVCNTRYSMVDSQ